ncbi:glycosyltransferase family 39 protein [Polyangium aurulentum]|uniref:glycosyltransferase family 39 protein n=1 Tax=Polyangium aurulentum TaxID=2567896 RepID=UPI0010AE1E56|nr:glycosyltransferase family 39 protein [Polyangium aurulentum]UQA62396.1 glycosyltransferase family 39 protein [Polyangium aurulentum]
MSARGRATDPWIVALAKVLVCAVALVAGFRAVSDDDFARVVIAQSWAIAPKLDPTGTSWLPFPFWVTGGVMLAAGRDLLVARALAVVCGIGSALLVLLAARRVAHDGRGALFGAIAAAVFPWSVRLGVATVPELPTAALSLFAMTSLVGPDPGGRVRIAGGAALLAATLSRYESWPVAAAFAALSVLDALRDRDGRARLAMLFSAGLALLGPALWVAWNHHARGSALDFLDRVAAYKRALGGADESVLSRLFTYPISMARHEPEIFGALAILLGLALAPRLRPLVRDALRPYLRPLAIALFQLAALSVAMVRDGTPTHHPERAVLLLQLLLAVLAGDLAALLLPRASRRARIIAAMAAMGVLALSLVIVRRWYRGEDFLHRREEVAIGDAARSLVPPGERVLVEVVDYGHFAVTAALARPEDVVLDRDLDPRKPARASSFADRAALVGRLEETGARWLIGRPSAATAEALGPPRLVHGSFGLWASNDRPSP